MPKFQIKRVSHDDDGTYGVFLIDDKPVCVTLEEEWDSSKSKVTGSDKAIMPGKYSVKAYSGTKFKNVFLLDKVPGRSAILIHNGNTEDNTAGCILVGKGYGDVNGKTAITDSVMTLNHLRAVLPKSFDLEIINCF